MTVACDDGAVDGNDNTVTITGHCARLAVSGKENRVTIDSANVISTAGIGDVVAFQLGSPHIEKGGISNVVTQG